MRARVQAAHAVLHTIAGASQLPRPNAGYYIKLRVRLGSALDGAGVLQAQVRAVLRAVLGALHARLMLRGTWDVVSGGTYAGAWQRTQAGDEHACACSGAAQVLEGSARGAGARVTHVLAGPASDHAQRGSMRMRHKRHTHSLKAAQPIWLPSMMEAPSCVVQCISKIPGVAYTTSTYACDTEWNQAATVLRK